MAKSKRRQMNRQNYNKTTDSNTEFGQDEVKEYKSRQDNDQTNRDEENDDF